MASAVQDGLQAVRSLPKRALREIRGDRLLLASIIIGAGVAAAVAWRYSLTWHVPGGDPGQWLLISHFYLGRGAPVYSHPVGYPPLFFIYLGGWVALLGDLPGLLVSVASVYFILAPVSYLFARELCGDRPRALLFAALVTTGPPILEMSTWGAYPNLFSFLFLFPAFHYGSKAWVRGARGDFRKLGLFCGLVALSHALSVAVLGIAILLVFVSGAVAGGRSWVLARVGRFVTGTMPVLLAMVLPFLAFQQFRADPFPEWVSDQPSPAGFLSFKTLYQKVDFTGQVAWFPENTGAADPFLWLSAVVVALLLFLTVREASRVRRQPVGERDAGASRLASRLGWWSLGISPLVLGLALFAARAETNLPRISYYMLFFVAGLIAWLVSLASQVVRSPEGRKASSTRRDPDRPDRNRVSIHRARRVAVFAIIVMLLGFWVGWAAFIFEANARYNSFFQDTEDRELAGWVSASTPADAVLVTTPQSFKWLGGLTGRTAFSYQEPWNMFRPDERVLARAAYQIHHHHLSLENGPVRARVQAFSGPSEFSPAVEWTDGLVYRGVQFPAEMFLLQWTGANGTKNSSLDELDGTFVSDLSGSLATSTARYTSSEIGNVHVNLTLPAAQRRVMMSIEWTGCTCKPERITLLGQAPADWWGAWARNETSGFSLFDSSRPEDGVRASFTPAPDSLTIVSGVEGKRTSVELRFDQSGAPARITASFDLPPSPVGFSPPEARLARVLVRAVGATHVIVSADSAAAWFIPSEYGYREVFSNAKYVVFETGL